MNLYLQLFLTFSKIGAFTVGGGYAMLPLVEREVVDNRKWITKTDFVDMLAISQSLPGIYAVNISILTGYRLRGYKGSIIATLGSILPSFLIILLIAAFFRHYNENPYIAKAFRAIRPAMVALIAVPVFTTARAIGVNLKTVTVPVVAALLIYMLGVSPVWIVSVAAVAGMFTRSKWFNRIQ
ncbi:MAG: chromate transporter [Dysgonamonadaceae bacterium]|jgi:chromate transporter|nr:chromate transporter [Dysgonamonadaceae bacterium]